MNIKKIIHPIKLIFKELKQVEWISLQQTIQSTMLVLVISFMIGIIIIAFDLLFYQGRDVILNL